MELSNSQYLKFVQDRLKLAPGKRKEYLAQVDTLIERFRRAAADDPDLKIQKFLKTGSMRKGTVIRDRVDADVAVYIDIPLMSDVLDDLHRRIKVLLKKAYPTKSDADFEVQSRTLGIEFIDSGLAVDLVPIIPDAKLDGYGWQPSSSGKPLTLTSVPGQLEFIRSHRDGYATFSALVRLLKRWRNEQELSQFSSFAVELIVCYLQDRDGKPTSLEAGLSRFWLFVAQELETTTVSFGKQHGGQGVGTVGPAPIVVIDPVNPDNNVTQRITKTEARELLDAAQVAWERLIEAQTTSTKGATLGLLRDVFGSDFDYE